MITQEKLQSYVSYDPGNGVFLWKVDRSQARTGAVAGKHTFYGYRAIGIEGRQYPAHRLAWLYMTGEWPTAQIDHINRVRDDNRFCNLRPVSIGENRQNMKVRKDSSTGFTGVSRYRGAYVAAITKDRKTHHLGRYESAEDAAASYELAKQVLHTYAEAV